MSKVRLLKEKPRYRDIHNRASKNLNKILIKNRNLSLHKSLRKDQRLHCLFHFRRDHNKYIHDQNKTECRPAAPFLLAETKSRRRIRRILLQKRNLFLGGRWSQII